jgi:hypothetical protein
MSWDIKSLIKMNKYEVCWRGLWDSTLKSAIVEADSEDEAIKIVRKCFINFSHIVKVEQIKD